MRHSFASAGARLRAALEAERPLQVAAITLHSGVKDRLNDIERVVIETQEPGVRIIDKTGPLAIPADRDHCIQYMAAVH
jgi:2-methylcitrate dehydratase PrpD